MIVIILKRRVFAASSIFLLLCAFAAWQETSIGFAQTGTLQWSRAIPISGALRGSRFPTLVAQDDGNVFLFWNISAEGAGTTMYVSKYDNGAWLRPVDVLIGGPRALALLDGRHRIRLLLNQGSNLMLAEADTLDATSVRGWDRAITFTHEGGGLFGDLALEADGTLDAVWLQAGPNCEKCFSVAYEKFGDKTSPELTYRVLSDLETVLQARIQILRAPSGKMYVAWDSPPQGKNRAGIKLSMSSDDGGTWLDEPHTAAFDEENLRQPLLFLDNANQLVLVYNYGNKDEIYYSVSTDDGETWSEPQAIPGLFSNLLASDTDNFAAAMDTTGITHLIAAGRASKPQTDPALYHVVWDGKVWSNLKEIFRGDQIPENPALAIGNGNRLHLSFATRGNGEDGIAASQIWYSNAQTDAPAATRIPLPTFTPAPTNTPEPEPTLTPTQTPFPTPLPLDPSSPQDTTPINPQLPILIGVLPVLLILLFVIIGVSLRRRR